MHRDRLEEALEQAAVSTLDRMLEQCRQLPEPLSALVAYIREHLFDLELTGTRAMEATGIRSHSVPADFRAYLETSIRGFIEEGRLEVGDRLLRLNKFRVGRISLALGYKNHETFLRAYKAWAGELPSEVGGKLNVPEIDYLTWRRFCHRELESPAAKEVMRRSAELYPEEAAEVSSETEREPETEPWLVVDGKDYLQPYAETVWQKIRPLTPEQQRRRMRGCEFRSEELFDLLRKKALEAGRLDRQQGIHLAELALISLERCVNHFGDRIHDLRALGHACVGNAHRLARDFPAADDAFERAKAEWRVARRDKDRGTWAKILDREVALRICQRNYDKALELIDRARDLYRLEEDLSGEASLLLQLAAIRNYSGEPNESIAALHEMGSVLDEREDPYLACQLYFSLSLIMVQVERYSSAAENLSYARTFCSQLADPLGMLKIQWLDALIRQGTGDIRVAEALLVTARTGYAAAQEFSSYGIISLDLMILYGEAGRWAEVASLGPETVSILSSLGLHDETLAAVNLFAEAVEAEELSLSLLRQVRVAVFRDPLSRLL